MSEGLPASPEPCAEEPTTAEETTRAEEPTMAEEPATAEAPLIPELEGYRTDFRWAKGEIRNLTAGLDADTYNLRPEVDRWSAAECVEHLSATARRMLLGLEEGIGRAREAAWLAGGPFEYGRLGDWFVRMAGAEELPPKRRFKAPAIYRPAQKRFEPGPAAEEFLALQDRYIETLQLASGVDLARLRIRSPVSPLIRLSLGQWFRLLAGHQRRHLWQARQALAASVE
jgi:hypothetical protein